MAFNDGTGLLSLSAGAPGASRRAAVLALQRVAGNRAVQRAASSARVTRLLQRDEPAVASAPPSASPQLPQGQDFQWERRGMRFSVRISKAWLLGRGVSPDATEISDKAIVKQLLSGLTAVAPWADIPALHANIKAFTPMRLLPNLGAQPATIVVGLTEVPVSLIGSPPGEDVVVQLDNAGAVVWVSSDLVRPHLSGPSAQEIADAGFSTRLFSALEAALGLQLTTNRDPGFRATFYATFPWHLPTPLDKLGRSAPFTLDADDLTDLFGADWLARARQSAPQDAGRVKGLSVSLPPALREQWPQILAVLKEIAGAPSGPKSKNEPRATISERDALLLLQIAKSPLRAKIVARLKATGGGDKSRSLSDVLENVIEEQELKDVRRRLDLSDPGTGGEEPVLKRPVHGDIVLTGGRPVPGKEAVFTFVTKDDVDAYRAPLIQIQWFAYVKNRPGWIMESEVNMYSPLRDQGRINDKLFEVTFPWAGTYVVEAIVNHNFFTTAHFRTEVKVLTEQQEVDFQEKGPLAGFAAPTGATTKKHDFDVGGITSAITDYEEGTITRGKLDPPFKAPTLADRLKVVDSEVTRVDALAKVYAKRPGDEAAAVRNWAEEYLKTLREGRSKVEADGKDSQLIPCTGVYVSRSKKAPSKALDLVCLQKRTPDGYRISLHDLSQVYEAENYHFEVDNPTAEGAYEEIFVEHAESYPDGTLSVAFQGWNEKRQAPTDSYVKFRKVTDTVGKDVKSNVFDPAVNLVVNITAAVMMVIPGLQAVGFALGIVWNTSQTLVEFEEKSAKGTLKDKDFEYAGASFALDVLPVIGASKRVVSLGRKAYYVIEGVQLAGQVLLITVQGAEQIEKVRNGVISKLAALNEKIAALERVNPSDPELDSLRAQQDRLIKDGQDAVISVYGTIVAEQAVMMVGGALIGQAATKKFAGRVGELETSGRFHHQAGETVRYDYAERAIVGDRQTMTQAQFEKVERNAGLAERLEGSVPDPQIRQRIVETIADGPIDIVVGAKKTVLEIEGDRRVLNIADGATPNQILAEAQRAKASTAPARRAVPGEDIDAAAHNAGFPDAATAPGHYYERRPDGSFELRQRAGSKDPPMVVVDEGAKKVLRPAAGPSGNSRFGLDAPQVQKLLSAVSPEQATTLHDFLGRDYLGKLTKEQPDRIKRVADALDRARVAAADPQAAAGLKRLGGKDHAKAQAMTPLTVANLLAEVPPGRMEVFLRVAGDPALAHPRAMGPEKLGKLANSIDELGFISEHGAAAYNEVRKAGALDPLLEKLRGLEPEDARALVDAVRSARTPAAMKKAVGIEPPVRRPRRATGRAVADKKDPGWPRHVERAQKFADGRRGLPDRSGKPYDATPDQIEMLATMYQILENAAGSRRLGHDKRIQLLDEFDALGRSAGLQTQWINNYRGGLSEALFAPSGGRDKMRLPHPAGGHTILDYAFKPNERAGSKTGRKEWVEQKSDLITAPDGEEVFRPAVDRARRYALDAELDKAALRASPDTAGDTILIEFVRSPGNDATKQAMLKTLFGPTSPIQAVKFADGAWIERAAFPAVP